MKQIANIFFVSLRKKMIMNPHLIVGVLIGFAPIHAHAQKFTNTMNLFFDSDIVTYREPKFIEVPEGYALQFPHRCITKTARNNMIGFSESPKDYPPYHEMYGKFIQDQMLDKDYIPIQEFDCDEVQYDYRNFSKVVLKSGSVPTNLDLRVDIVYWSNHNAKETYLFGLNSDYPYKYTAINEFANNPGYFYWSKVTDYRPHYRVAERSVEVPIGYKVNNSEYIYDLPESYIQGWNISNTHDQLLFQDYGFFKINSIEDILSDLTIYQFRTPMIGDIKSKSTLSTIFKVIVSISKYDLIKKCSLLSHEITKLESNLDMNEQYLPLIDALVEVSSNSNQNVYIYYFYETQDTVDKLINFLETRQDEFGVEGEIFSENLKAISIFKKNSCIANWDIGEVQNAPDQFVENLNQCKILNKISNIDYYLVNQFVEKLAQPDDKNDLSKIISDIKNVERKIQRSKVDVLANRQAAETMLTALSGKAKELCEIAISSRDFPYTDPEQIKEKKFKDE